MFQPQPTPFSPFLSYGGATDQDQEQSAYNYQSSGLGLGSGGSIEFDNPVFSPVSNYRALQLNPQHNRYGTMNAPLNDDLEAQEALARNYQPESTGPLVGKKRSSLEITEEYAKADPIYVAKTSTLPQLYSHYRPVKGDGNCGWRAIAFSYFETLLRLGDKTLIEAESARMMSLSDFIIAMTGREAWIFEDYRDQSIELLEEIANHTPMRPSPDDILLPKFNDEMTSNGLVYWCRLLACAYIKSHPLEFQDFIPDLVGVDSYCKNVLEPINNEIDHLGITLLVEVLLKPISVAVEVVYLDRSEGTRVNTHYFAIETPNSERATVHLLYRPGHYDVLYKEPIAPKSKSRSMSQHQLVENAAAHTDLRVNSVTRLAHRHSIQSTPGEYAVDMNILLNFPPQFGPSTTGHGFSEPFSPIQEFSPQPTHAASYSMDSSRTTHSISPVSSISPGPSFLTPSTLPIHTHSITAEVSPTATRMTTPSTSQFRPSMYQYKDDWGDTPAQGFQTSTFKNSHYNVSHYNNPNFQPEQWTPYCDEAVGKLTRHRTS